MEGLNPRRVGGAARGLLHLEAPGHPGEGALDARGLGNLRRGRDAEPPRRPLFRFRSDVVPARCR